ncbi:uncharacterized protein BXZ73DRAFT_44908 [Epithele typhae]|uniref:uncharacterized protein n=1 Tax=Epithele typhae TaxID=378194 RepID=UPI002008BFAD|nr:uncharacterized protein BXZ73DRAFT_44908 [Epithele typhae]KAH9936830.1 hypothetical protein BXZ73DRAFT_44908 [Epithele typhae]
MFVHASCFPRESHTDLNRVQPPRDIKVKRKDLLNEEDILDDLAPDAIEPFPIDVPEEIREVTVTRAQLSTRFGGSPQDPHPVPRAELLAEHGRDNFMCLNLMYNPHAPTSPGFPGLSFHPLAFLDDAPPLRRQALFIRLNANKWRYMGDYVEEPSSVLSVERWRRLTPRVRKKWNKGIATKKWGSLYRARVSLRRSLGREPTRAEIQNAKGPFRDVTQDHLAAAFDSGLERMRAWTMKCVGYDEELQRICVEISRIPPEPAQRSRRRPKRKAKA